MKYLKCNKKERGSKQRCGEPMELVREGGLSSKYDSFYCKVHGNISVKKGAKTGEHTR